MSGVHDASRGWLCGPLVAIALAGMLLLFSGAALGQSGFGGGSQATPFLGTWCAQGDPSKQTSIASSGGGIFLTLTNEVGGTSMGSLKGSNQIQAPQWNFVTGTLSSNGSQINWSNGTMWARCRSGGSNWPRHAVQLSGTWFANGDHSKPCSIQQRGDRLDLRNEVGQSGSGSVERDHQITAKWGFSTIQGRITHHGKRIDWSNGTWWTRDKGH